MAGSPGEPERSSDEWVVAALRSGDEQVFTSLVTGWASSMLRLARSHVPTDSAAEEVVQDTWLGVLKGLEGFHGKSSFRTWVFRILVNQAKTRGVRERRTVPFATLAPDDEGPSVDPSRFMGPHDLYPGGWRYFPQEWPEQVALSNEVHHVIHTALESLPPRQRAVVSLRDLAGHSSEEVSSMLQITTGNERVLLHRGRSVVRAHLERYFAGAPVREVV
jgi:RNA polymerase sigma-70 factor (ECF subfamily)